MGSQRRTHCGISVALYLAIIVASTLADPGFSSQHRRRWKEKPKDGNVPGQPPQSIRDPKFFPLLSFVTLPASTCQTDMGTLGACMRSKTCTRLNGLASGACGMNFGVCCLINKVCTGNGSVDTVTQNGTHLIQPTVFTDLCRYEIPRQDGVCQIRLDFNEFVINQGVEAVDFGDCNEDMFTVSGSSNAMLGPLCGDLRGQHMYLEYGTSDKINLDMYLQTWMQQKWDISVTMIRCDSLEKAPSGCLQYYTAQTAMVRSFNYNNRTQLNNQDYSVCIRSNVGMRKITWKPCMTNPTVTTDFSVSGGPPFPGDPSAVGISITGSPCMTDWVQVLGSDKYCGSLFPETVTSTSQPFILQVHFNDAEFLIPSPPPVGCGAPGQPACMADPNSDGMNQGFCLKYSQSPFV